MRRLARWYDSLSEGWRLVIGSFVAALIFYLTPFLSISIYAALNLGGWLLLIAHAIAFISVLFLVIVFSRSLAALRHERQRIARARHDNMMLAYSRIDRFEINLLREAGKYRTPENFVEYFVTSLHLLQSIVQDTYETLEAAYHDASDINDRMDFEATFMTNSYIDGKITIPAAANRDGRLPRSMILREKTPDIYDRSVTALVYREDRPTPHIISDTSSSSEYAELYSGQTARIKSSIVFPVLSEANTLLGTLVVHCNRAGFFRKEDSGYWTELLEVFAKRLAVVKQRMDKLVELRRQATNKITIDLPEPWF